MPRWVLAAALVVVAAVVAGVVLVVLSSGTDEGPEAGGVTQAGEIAAAEPAIAVDRVIEANGLRQAVRPGAVVFIGAGCESCHTYAGTGSANLGARDLTSVGTEEGKTVAYFRRYVAHPRKFGNKVMPPFASLGKKNLQALAAFLEASRGGR